MPRPSADRDDDERDDLPRRKRKKPASTAWLWILLGCSGVALLGCVIGGGAIAVIIGSRASPPDALDPDPRIQAMPGLLAYWSFDKVEGNRVIDHSGRNNHLTLIGVKADAPGARGLALALNGQPNQYAEIPASNDFNFAHNAPFTFAGWFRTPQNRACILSLTSARGNQQIDMLVRDNRFICVVGDDTDLQSKGNAYVWSRVQNDGQWHHFAIARNGNAIDLWIDAVHQGQMGAANSGGPVTTELRAIGSERAWIVKNDQRWGNPGIDGAIDEVCVFNRVLAPAEIQALFEH